MAQGQIDLESWMSGIRQRVDAILERFFESKCKEANDLSPAAIELVAEASGRQAAAAVSFTASTAGPTNGDAQAVPRALELVAN